MAGAVLIRIAVGAEGINSSRSHSRRSSRKRESAGPQAALRCAAQATLLMLPTLLQ